MNAQIGEALRKINVAHNETESAMGVIKHKYEAVVQENQRLQSMNRELTVENQKLRCELARLQNKPEPVEYNGNNIASESAGVGDAFQLEHDIKIHEAPVHAVTLDNKQGSLTIATASWDSTAKLYDLSSKSVVKTLGEAEGSSKMGGLYAVAFAKTADNILGCTSCDHKVYLWNTMKGEQLTKLSGHSDEVNGIDFHSSQQVMCTASDDCKAIIWDFQEGIMLRTLDKHTKAVYGVSFLGQEYQYFVGTCCFDQKTRIFDMRDKQVVALLQTHTDDVIGIDYTSSKQLLATGSDDGQICLWDAKTWKLQHKISTRDRKAENEVKRVRFSNDGSKLAAACSSGQVLVYDLNNGYQNVATLEGHTDCVFDVTWGVNQVGKQILVSASHDHSCKYWIEK